ncbi:Ubiquitinyl hydrolase 1, partial [Bertholletia excelsa]
QRRCGFRLETLNPSSSDSRAADGCGQSAPPGKKQDGPDFLDVGLDPELSFPITFKRIGAGLENLGNTCFLNSVLQCLTYTEPLAAYLQSGKHQNSCRTAGFCALCAIQKHVSRALQLTGRSLAPKEIVSNLRCISRNFRNSRQEDAHEYMVNLLESMHRCCLPAGEPSESPSAYERSLVHKIFGGRLRSQVKCMQCSFCSNKFDPFLDLSLEILKAESLQKALVHFTAKEYLDGGERQYQCQRCNQKVKALKQLTIHKAPHVLTIHLKRFGAHQHWQKIDKKVHFGPALDLKPCHWFLCKLEPDYSAVYERWVSEIFALGFLFDGDLKYTLYGVLVHAGSNTRCGHYYCFVRTSSGMWYSLDDHQVRQVSEKVVLEQKAYMLFYVRDRRQLSLRKPGDAFKKESLVVNPMGANLLSNSNQGLKGTIQNGPVDKKVNGVNPIAVVAHKNENITSSLNENIKKEALIQKTDSPKMVESLGLTKDSSLHASSKVPISKDAVNRNVLTNEYSKENDVKKLGSLVAPAPSCSSLLYLIAKEEPSNEVAKHLTTTGGGSTRKNLSDSIPSVPNCCNGQNNLAICVQQEKQTKSLKRKRTVDNTKSLSLQMKHRCQQDALDFKRLPKLKKKLLKYQVMTMYFSSSILFSASLSLRKKMHKRIKRRVAKIKKLSLDHLSDREGSTADCGPSTSEITKTLSEIKSPNCNVGEGISDELGARRDENGAMLARDKQPQRNCGSSLMGSHQDAFGANCSKESRRVSGHSGLMSILTRGLEDRVVARWDGLELPTSQITESTTAEAVGIGYVVDEWDEEYDRGRRKKVRSFKDAFGGLNPFQEIASKKAKLKK